MRISLVLRLRGGPAMRCGAENFSHQTLGVSSQITRIFSESQKVEESKSRRVDSNIPFPFQSMTGRRNNSPSGRHTFFTTRFVFTILKKKIRRGPARCLKYVLSRSAGALPTGGFLQAGDGRARHAALCHPQQMGTRPNFGLHTQRCVL